MNVDQLVAERQAARDARDWVTADAIRHRLHAEGIVLEDTAEGSRWRRRFVPKVTVDEFWAKIND